MHPLTVSAFIRTNTRLKPHVSVANGPMPVAVMIHRLIDKTFSASVTFGILALATGAIRFCFNSLHVQPNFALR